MSQYNYLVNKHYKLALGVRSFDSNDIFEGTWRNHEEFVDYMSEEDVKFDVMKYLWNKTFITNSMEGMLNMFMDVYDEGDWDVVPEIDINNEEYKDLHRVEL